MFLCSLLIDCAMLNSTYHIPFPAESIGAILEIKALQNLSDRPPVYVRLDDEVKHPAFLENDEYKKLLGKHSVNEYFPKTREHALQILLSRFGLLLSKKKAKFNVKRYSRADEAKLRKLSEGLLDLLGLSNDALVDHKCRAIASNSFRHIENDNHNESLVELVRILRILAADGFAKSAVGFLVDDDFIENGKRRKPLGGNLSVKDKLIRIETSYLCSLWSDLLHQELKTSVNPATNEPSGPLVEFFRIVLAHWHPKNTPSGSAIRERIRRHLDPVGRRGLK